jgi:Uncharacterized protein conserved in bacteria
VGTTDELREWALSLPEAVEEGHWGKRSYRVRGKIFAVEREDGVTVLLKTTKEQREADTTLAPHIFRIPETFSHLAFILVRMDLIDRDERAGRIEKAWRLAAPKSFAKLYPDRLLR